MANKVDFKHPEWTDHKAEWDRMRDCYRGEEAVKRKRQLYLPMPSGFNGTNWDRLSASAFNGEGVPANWASDQAISMYGAYILRAQFPEILSPTVSGILGLIHRTETQIEGIDGTGLEYLWETATLNRLTLEEFHEHITREIVLMGRFGGLVDVPMAEVGAGGRGQPWEPGLPYFAPYRAETIINWDDDHSFFVLDESGKERDGFEWKDETRFRVLRLEGGTYSQQTWSGGTNDDNAQAQIIPLRARGGGPLNEIPFVLVGSREVSTRVESSPLKGVSQASLSAYRLDADYRHQLFHTGQETLFCIGIDEDKAPAVIGSGVVHTLPAGSDAKYVGPSGKGIEAHRLAIQDEFDRAVSAGARIFDASEQPTESGAAKKIRFAAETATLTSISVASSHALERMLRHAGRFIGMSDQQLERIVVKPNLKFVSSTLTPAEAKDLVAIWMQGAISKVTLYERLQQGEVASPERTFEEEEAIIETENPIAGIDELGDEEGETERDDDAAAGGRQGVGGAARDAA